VPRRLAAILLTVLLIAGCSSIGPQTVTKDRFDYNEAISRSWKEQTLLNIVKIRYADMPLFVEVTSIVAGYTLEGTVNIGAAVSSNSVTGDVLSLGSGGKYTDRPTITYQPITGQKFNKSFMTPIPPRAILFLLQSGWAADVIFPITVDAINGHRAQVGAGSNQREGDNNYYRIVTLLRELQKSGTLGMRIRKSDNNDQSTVMLFHQQDIDEKDITNLAELRKLLGLSEGKSGYKIKYGLIAKDDMEIAMLTRSMLQIMVSLSAQIEVPEEDVSSGRTFPSLYDKGDSKIDGRYVKISHSKDPPEDTFVSVKYRDHWFWIDDRDLNTKRAFAFLMILFSLSETGGSEGLPLVTIPAS